MTTQTLTLRPEQAAYLSAALDAASAAQTRAADLATALSVGAIPLGARVVSIDAATGDVTFAVPDLPADA